MRKFNGGIIGVVCVYAILAVISFSLFGEKEQEESMAYKVEVNEIMTGLEERGTFFKPVLDGKEAVREVSFLSSEDMGTSVEIQQFFGNKNGVSSLFRPFFSEGKLIGFVRFDYVATTKSGNVVWVVEGILLLSFSFIFVILVYIKYKILKPFSVLRGMPYELSKGHLQGELEENKNRFFGKFVWGIAMLRDTLSSAKAKELELEKEKKLLLLSLSHDIKIPLSTIKLYAKALNEGVYDTEEKRIHAAGQIEAHALEIEKYVKEIVTASSEDIFVIEVENSEFYLKDLVEKIRLVYEPKCRLSMIDFTIGKYSNKLLKGDFDRAFEVMENLFHNAFKYGDGKQIRIDFYEEDYCQVIQIFNTGAPIASEEMPHIFDSFYRGSNVGKESGNGLGLYISKKIMQKMEGEIFAQRIENGMCFGVVLRM